MNKNANHNHRGANGHEALLKGVSVEEPTKASTRRLTEDLQVYQIELEQQNEELRRIRNDLEAARDRYFRLYDLAPVGYMTLSAKGLIVEANLTAAGILEQERGALLKKPLTRFIPKADQTVFYHCRQQLLDTRKPQLRELQMLKANGETFWVRLEASLMQAPNGMPLYNVVISDITTLKHNEARLLESHSLLATTLEAVADGVLVVSNSGQISVYNQRFLDLWNIPRPLAETYTDAELVQFVQAQLEEPDGFIESIKMLYATEATLTDELTFRDGRVFERHSQPQYANGVYIGRVFSFRDITARRRAEEDRLTREAAEAASRAKSAFLANMSHEIRTPLNAVIGFAQILERDSSLNPVQAHQVEIIARSGKHLLNLINDILDLSRIESGQQSLNNRDFNLHDVLDEIENMFRSRSEAKGLQLLVERHASVPQFVTADEGKLRQVLINLLGNAVKFTERGGVAVRARADAPAAVNYNLVEEVRLRVEVEDSGPGIAKAEQALIFEAFQQSDAGRSLGGTGLGLPISRSLIGIMGGQMGLTSQLGRGTCFYIEVPLKLAAGRPRQPKRRLRRVTGLAPESTACRILIVDDNQTNRELLHDLLQPIGFELQEAVNGQQALDAFETWAPDVVLMDMRMPVMDGYEATRRLKATPRGQKTPVIAVTASAFMDTEQAVMDTGAEAYVRKPFRPEEIFAVLEKALGLRYVYADATERPESRSRAARLTPADLATLPLKLVQMMHQAVEEGDMTQLKQVLQEVEAKNPVVAQSLRQLAEQYDYEQLLQLLNPVLDPVINQAS